MQVSGLQDCRLFICLARAARNFRGRERDISSKPDRAPGFRGKMMQSDEIERET